MIRSNRARRAALKARARTTRAASRINRRGTGTLASHAIAQGLAPRDARSMVSTLRKVAAKLGVVGIPGRIHRGRRMRDCQRYTPAAVALIAAAYRPRRLAFKLAAARLVLAA
ncbi:hypothetical protein [Streptomyces olivaceus]|uniref:hypothetical protein n=1 Tax=Streptomyces olivaceus TaxID=47716 RepID=UPI00367467FE